MHQNIQNIAYLFENRLMLNKFIAKVCCREECVYDCGWIQGALVKYRYSHSTELCTAYHVYMGLQETFHKFNNFHTQN